MPVAVIPARFASTRFPGKPLALLDGQPMLQHVHARCVESGAFSRILVATDDARIADAARSFGAEVVVTSPDCLSGTDRVAEVARTFQPDARFVNVQGDEPLIAPEALRSLAAALSRPGVRMVTLVRPLEEEERANPNVVKAVVAAPDFPGAPRRALYFSRADVPFVREPGDAEAARAVRFAHLGVYGYTREALLTLAGLPPSPLELAERLEQLRALEAGIPIHCVETAFRGLGVDSPEDLARAETLIRARKSGPPKR